MSDSTQPTTETNPIEGYSYEEALTELEEIVLRLEGNEHTLENALELYERGQKLANHCSELLEKAELRVRQIVGEEISDFDRKI
jgi:exodeoxyribonuclease VII small subunit